MIFNRPRIVKKKSTWVFQEDMSSKTVSRKNFDARFTCDNSMYTGIDYQSILTRTYVRYVSDSGDVTVYSTNGWKQESYRTITFEEEPTGDLLTWLQANATPQ